MFFDCSVLQSKRAREAAKGVVDEGLELERLPGRPIKVEMMTKRRTTRRSRIAVYMK